jgi:hypothetical protein
VGFVVVVAAAWVACLSPLSLSLSSHRLLNHSSSLLCVCVFFYFSGFSLSSFAVGFVLPSLLPHRPPTFIYRRFTPPSSSPPGKRGESARAQTYLVG